MDPLGRWRRARKDRARRRALEAAGIGVEVEVPYELHGARSGVWPWVPTASREPVVYAFGVGDNAAWEREVMARYGARVFAFDPTPVSVAWVAGQAWPDAWSFAPVGLAAFDGEMGFRAPRKGANFTPVDDGEGSLRAPVRRLETLLGERGHGSIDVLKLDIEGGEYAVLDALAAEGRTRFPVPVRTVLLELHHGMGPYAITDTRRVIDQLRAAGFHPFWISPRGLELGFVCGPGVAAGPR